MVVEMSLRPMDERQKKPYNIERLEYIGELLVELDAMAFQAGFFEVSLLSGLAALSAAELEKELKSLAEKGHDEHG